MSETQNKDGDAKIWYVIGHNDSKSLLRVTNVLGLEIEMLKNTITNYWSNTSNHKKHLETHIQQFKQTEKEC